MRYALSQKKEFLEEFERLVTSSQKILLVSHIRPDDDAIGSLVPLYIYVSEKYPDKTFKMALTTSRDPRWDQFPRTNDIQCGKDIADELETHDLLVVVDTSNFNRISNRPEVVEANTIKKICIDNHGMESRSSFDLMCIEVETASVSQMIAEIFFEDTHFSTEIAEYILMGIVGDTGWFQWNLSGEKSRILSLAKRTIDEGHIDIEKFKEKFWLEPSRTFLIIQDMMKNAKLYEINGWPKIICSYVDEEFVAGNGFSDEELSMSVGKYTNTYNAAFMTDVPWGLSLYPRRDGSVKASLRSRAGSVNVRLIAEQMGLGTGHDGASGLIFPNNGQKLKPEEAIEQFLEFLRIHTPVMR